MQKTALYKSLGLTLSAILISACSSTGEVSEGDSSTEPTATETGTTVVDTKTVSGEDMAAEKEAAALREQTVFYFDFDQSSLKADGKPSLMAHAAYLKNNPATRVVLEGHADERGTVEYNLALGERRAMTVRRFLMANGAAAEQLEVVSFGEERPAVMGHNETSYAKNRRVEVKYQR